MTRLLFKNFRHKFHNIGKSKRWMSVVSSDSYSQGKLNFNEIFSVDLGSLSSNGKQLQVHAVWLRHHCQCDVCYNYKTHQRVNIPSNLPTISTITGSAIEGNHLSITWNDGHNSKYELSWLNKNVPDANRVNTSFESHLRNFKVPNISSSTRTRLENPLESSISYKSFMKAGNEGVAHLLSNLIKYGYGLVKDVPPDFETTKSVITKVSQSQNTFYGDVIQWTSDLAHADTAYTSDVVHMHNDTTYFTEPSGLQIFHCLEHQGTGGLNSFIDGFNVAEKVAKENEEFYKLLSTIKVPCQYIDVGKHHYYNNDVTFAHDQFSGELLRVRYNPHDMAILKDLPFEYVGKFYQSLVNLSDHFEANPQNIRLTPGLVIFLDNWRVLHGRSAFTGFRRMCGAYIARSDWLSRARTLGLLKDY